MKIENIVSTIVTQKNIHIPVDNNDEGLKIALDNGELIIQGSSGSLLELANYIINVALSSSKEMHLHIDEETLLSYESQVKQLIIEKE